MNEQASKIIGFLFLQGIPTKKETIAKACHLSAQEFFDALSQLKQALHSLPFTLLESDSEIQLVLTSEMTSYFESFIKRARDESLTQATLQTLTVIAYLGVASKFEISFIRGVSSTQSISTLLSKSLIDEIEEDKYTLSVEALSHLGVTKREDLPNFEKIQTDFKQKIENASLI